MAFFWILFFVGTPPKGFISFKTRQQLAIRNVRNRVALPLICMAGLLHAISMPWSLKASPAWAESPPALKVFPHPAPPLSVLTLDQAIRQALDQNPELARDKAVIARNKARSVEASELPDPRIVIGEQYFPISFDMGESLLTMTTVGIRQDFSPWGKRALVGRSSLKKETASRWELEDKKASLVRNIRIAWLDYVRARRTRDFLKSIGSIWEKAFQAALVRYRQGIGPESDVLSAQFQKDDIRDRQEGLRIQEEESLHRLMRLMHVSRPFRISSEEPRIPDPLPEAVLLERLDAHPALVSRDAKDASQVLLVRAAEKDKIPAFSVEGDYNYFMGPSPITATPNLFSLVLTFNLPVRPGERQDQKIAESEHELEALEAERESLREKLIEEIRNTEEVYRLLERRAVLLRQDLLPETKRNMEAALIGYKTGTEGMGQVLSAMEKVETTGIRELSNRIERLKAKAELSYLAGATQGGSREP